VPTPRAILAGLSSRSLRTAEGTMKRLTDKGFGFVETGDRSDLFFP
jgi:hypothetical protein